MKINLNISKKIFNDVYYPFLLDYSHRYEIYYGGAGSGKSQFVFQKIIIKACRSKRKVLVVRKTAKSNENSTFAMTKDILSQFHLLELCKVNKTTQRIQLPNDSVFIFAGLDDVEKLKSIAGITDIVIEEATEITEDDYQQLDLRLRAKEEDLQIYFMFNPVSKVNWVYKKWFSPEAEVNENTFILHTTYKDNRFLPQAYVDSIEEMSKTNPNFYKVYALGEFATLDKLVFNNWVVKPFDADEFGELELLVGLDWGYVNDKTAIIASLLDQKEKTIYIFDAWGKTGLTNEKIAERIKEMGYSKSVIIADSAEQKSIDEVKQCGIHKIKAAKKGKGSILGGIQKLQAYTIVIHPALDDVIEEFQNYCWKKDKQSGEYVNEPIDAYNHFIDALRYSLQCSLTKLRTLNKNAL